MSVQGHISCYFKIERNLWEMAEKKNIMTYTGLKKLEDELHDLKSVYNLRSLKQAYRALTQKFHPDHGGNVEMFKLVNIIYKVRKNAISSLVEDFGNDDDFAEIVDMAEEALKVKEGIQY